LNKDLIGLISGVLVVLSAIPYIWRVWQGKIRTNVTSWTLWSFIGLTLLITFRSSGAEANIWPAVFGFTNPCLVLILSIWRQGERSKPSRSDWVCIAIAVIALVGWFFVRNDKDLAQYALYLSIVADAAAGIPTIAFLWYRPWEDRPGAWGAFAVSYGLSMFAMPELTVANFALPIWMIFASGSITVILVIYRHRARVPLGEWI
jgi:hypothetical protein